MGIFKGLFSFYIVFAHFCCCSWLCFFPYNSHISLWISCESYWGSFHQILVMLTNPLEATPSLLWASAKMSGGSSLILEGLFTRICERHPQTVQRTCYLFLIFGLKSVQFHLQLHLDSSFLAVLQIRSMPGIFLNLVLFANQRSWEFPKLVSLNCSCLIVLSLGLTIVLLLISFQYSIWQRSSELTIHFHVLFNSNYM